MLLQTTTHLCPSICSPLILAHQIIKSYGWFSKRLKVSLYSNSQFVNLFEIYTCPSFQRLIIQESLWRLCFLIICSFRLLLSYCCNLLLSGQHELELYFWFLSLRIQKGTSLLPLIGFYLLVEIDAIIPSCWVRLSLWYFSSPFWVVSFIVCFFADLIIFSVTSSSCALLL